MYSIRLPPFSVTFSSQRWMPGSLLTPARRASIIAAAYQVKAVLLGQPSPLVPVYRLALAYEKADWEAVSALLRELNVPEGQVADSYQRSITWSSEILFIDRS